jgi:chromosome segregation ATPase
LEKDITKLFEELDMMSYNDFSQKRVKRVKQLFEKYQTFSSSKEQLNNTVEMHEKNLGVKITEFNKLKRESQTVEYEFGEIESNSLKKKIVEITEEHKAIMSLNSKTMNSIVKMHEKALEDKNNELNKVKDELRVAKSTNLKISEKIQELETFNVSKENESENLKKKFCCVICDLRFAYKQSLMRHKASVHEGKKSFKCEICKLLYVQTALMTP